MHKYGNTFYSFGFTLLFFTMLYSVSHSVSATPFDLCPTQAFLSQYSNGATHYKSVDLATGSVTTLQTDDGLEDNVVNAIAFNEADRFVYGFNKNRLALVQFDREFNATVLPFINPPQNNFYVGDIYNNRYYFYRKNIGLFYTTLEPTDPNYLIINKISGADQSMGIADFAFHPLDGKIYAVGSKNGDIYQIDPSDGTSTVVANTGFTAPGSNFGAAYFDVSGYLYFVRNNDGNIYRADITDPNNITGNTVYFAQASPTNSNDGARCANAPVVSTNTDYGDAPDSYGTTLANNGARHLINYDNYFLGSAIDSEADAAVYPDTDEAISTHDEDGILFQTTLVSGLDSQLNVTIGGAAESYLNAWFDWNQDGDFNDADEHVFTGLQLSPGSHNLLYRVPTTASIGKTWSRFRVGDTETIGSNGGYVNGEVEDYEIAISAGYTSYIYYPSQNDFVSLAYEDMWPKMGDYDFNDVVIYYRVTQVLQENKVTRFDITGQLSAYGASYANGFAIQLPGIPRAQINEALVKLTHNSEVLQTSAALEQNQTNAVVIVSDNLKNNFAQNNCGLNFYRTQAGCSNSDTFKFEISIPLLTPIAQASIPDMPLDPFIFASTAQQRSDFFAGVIPGRSLEIHLADKPLTDLGSSIWFGQQDDKTALPSSIFRTANNLPWAIEVGRQWYHPFEHVDITEAYPEFINFIQSGSTLNTEWFDHPVISNTFQ
jgi:LruC domain-containing protein